EIPHRDARVTHMACHAHARHYARGETGCADGPGGTVEHGAVGILAAAKVVALHQTRETAALADSDDVYLVLGLELVYQHLVARLQVVVTGAQRELPEELRAVHTGLLQVARRRFVDALRLDEFHQTQLHRIVSVRGGRLALRHHARTRLQQRHRDGLPVGTE